MRKLTTWETKEISRIITLEIRVTILEMQVGTMLGMVSMIGQQIEIRCNWHSRDGYRNDRSGVYVPPGNRDRASGSFSVSKLEDMMAKVL